MSQQIFITGLGICSPIGSTLDEVVESIEAGRSGIREIQSFDSSKMVMRHAAEVDEIPCIARFPSQLYQAWDRGTRMAMHAVFEALQDASIDVSAIAAERIGVCIGTSGSGQYQNARFRLDRDLGIDDNLSFFLSRNAPHYQSSQIAAQFGIRGPNLAIGAATAGGGIALATALSWVRTGRVDMVVVGGSESFSLLNVLGFDQLGLTIPHPCTPFSGQPGMTFGEGAGFLILESEASRRRRGVRSWATLDSAAIRADGFDSILFDPSGNGQMRAMSAALEDAGRTPEEIDWIRASGTGGRDQDLAETLAIRCVFKNPPPVSSLEPYYGHANGAGPAIGLVSAVLCMKNNLIPQTIGCTAPRQGCDLDYVGEGHRHTPVRHVLCNTAAFGGVNTAIVFSKTTENITQFPQSTGHSDRNGSTSDSTRFDDVVITGIGMISARGCGNHELAEEFLSGDSDFQLDAGLLGTELENFAVGFVRNFSSRQLCPAVKLRGLESLTQYAAGATALALKDAQLDKSCMRAERTGVVSGITRSSGTVFARLFSEIGQNGFRPMVGRLMLRNGRFMVASQLAQWFELRGYTSTISLGVGCGLHGLIAAYDQLRQDPSLDVIVVLATDELSPFTLRTMKQGRILAQGGQDWQVYGRSNCGMIPGEGAVAIVLERRKFAEQRGANVLAQLAGAGTTFDGLPGAASLADSKRPLWEAIDPTAEMLVRAFDVACNQAAVDRQKIDLVMGNGTGVCEWDAKELRAIEQYFGGRSKLACVNGQLGVCEAAGPLFNLAAAVYAMKTGRAPFSPIAEYGLSNSGDTTFKDIKTASSPIRSRFSQTLITSNTEHGHNAAVILKALPDRATS